MRLGGVGATLQNDMENETKKEFVFVCRFWDDSPSRTVRDGGPSLSRYFKKNLVLVTLWGPQRLHVLECQKRPSLA